VLGRAAGDGVDGAVEVLVLDVGVLLEVEVLLDGVLGVARLGHGGRIAPERFRVAPRCGGGDAAFTPAVTAPADATTA
jgi:hypothetical protein